MRTLRGGYESGPYNPDARLPRVPKGPAAPSKGSARGYLEFWACPVEGHSDSKPGGPVETVRWEGDFAWCLTPGCRNTNARVPAPANVDPPYVLSELLDRLTEAEGQILAQLGVSLETIVSYGGMWMEKVWPILAAGLKQEQS